MISILGVVYFIKNKRDFHYMIKSFLYGNSIVLTIMILLNINRVFNPSYYYWILAGTRSDRLDFGFFHPNTVAMYLYIQIILLFFMYLLVKNMKYIFISVIYLLSLFPTGSRTGVYCTLITLTLFILFSLIGKLDKKIKIVMIPLLFPMIIYGLSKINWSSIWTDSSGRDVHFSHNLNYLKESNNFLFGIGPVNITNIQSYNSLIQITDNWYLINTIMFGVISTVLFCVFIVWVLIKQINILFNNIYPGIISLGISFLIGMLIYSLFENVLYNPGVILSCVFWPIVLSILNINIKSDNSMIGIENIKPRRRSKRYRLIL
jgi:hypothetical protein